MKKFGDLTSYQAPQEKNWSGRNDHEDNYFHQIIELVNIQEKSIEKSDHGCAILGFASDEGVKRNLGRRGAFLGPKYIREFFGPLCLPQKKCPRIFDLGNIRCENGQLERAQKELGVVVSEIINNEMLPIVLGGGHEVAYASYQGIAESAKSEKLLIINFDAHLDLRTPENNLGSSGTPFFQIHQDRMKSGLNFDYLCVGVQAQSNSRSLLDFAQKSGVSMIFAEEIFRQGVKSVAQVIQEKMTSFDRVYLTICLDVFANAFAPGVSAPQAFGLTPWQVQFLLNEIFAQKKVMCLDIAELCPKHDRQNMTAKLAANILWHCLNEYIPN